MKLSQPRDGLVYIVQRFLCLVSGRRERRAAEGEAVHLRGELIELVYIQLQRRIARRKRAHCWRRALRLHRMPLSGCHLLWLRGGRNDGLHPVSRGLCPRRDVGSVSSVERRLCQTHQRGQISQSAHLNIAGGWQERFQRGLQRHRHSGQRFEAELRGGPLELMGDVRHRHDGTAVAGRLLDLQQRLAQPDQILDGFLEEECPHLRRNFIEVFR